MKLKLVDNSGDIQLTKLSCVLALSLPGTVIIQHSTVAGWCQTWVTSLVALEDTLDLKCHWQFSLFAFLSVSSSKSDSFTEKPKHLYLGRRWGQETCRCTLGPSHVLGSAGGLPGSCPWLCLWAQCQLQMIAHCYLEGYLISLSSACWVDNPC